MKTKDEIIQELTRENKELRARIEELEALVKTLLGTSLSTPSSQIPPYSKPNKSSSQDASPKKKKGAPKGHPGNTRSRLTEDDVAEISFDESKECPHCSLLLQKLLRRSHIVETFLPAKRLVKHFFWFEGRCPKHGEVSRRPASVSQNGYFSNEVFLTAAQLITDGLSLEKVRRHFKERMGIEITTSGLTQGLQRIAVEMAEEYQAIEDQLPHEEVVYVDETGGRVNGESNWLWAFVNQKFGLYRMEEERSSSIVKEVLGEDFDGTLISDFFSAYGSLLPYKKQKCLSHLLTDIKESLMKYAGMPGRPPPFLIELKALLKEALELKKKKEEFSGPEYAQKREGMEQRMNRLLVAKSENADALRLQKRIRKHRNELFVFLYKDKVEGTNNRAERGIRPAVCQRKMNGGHRSWFGAHTYAVLMSIVQTCRFQGRDFIQTSLQILQNCYRGLTPGILL